jgi:NAD(P)-dependent dehydrogenase (short-subunit alcohol dehydrogenase family)
MRFAGKVALITGAGSGIGQACARRLADEGARVLAGVLSPREALEVADLDHVVLDVRSDRDWSEALVLVESTFGGLDVLVNSAGIYHRGAAETIEAAVWDEVMAVNLWGTFLGCRGAIPLLRRRGGGAIVNLASIAALDGVPQTAAYSASKGGVAALTRALAMELAGDRIRVNCVCPGATGTPMIGGLLASAPDPAAMRAALVALHPMGRLATAEEVAGAIAFLASDDAAFMTGLSLPVDGGRSVGKK